MVGGYFEMSNQPDFSHAQLVHFVDTIPQSGLQFISIQSDKAYRYLRFYKRRNGISIGEMGALDNQGILIKGTPIADGILQHDPALKNVNDNRILSYIDINGIDDTWVGIDWGKPIVAGKLFFSPRTDDNEVSVGDAYELFYWDKEWISMGMQTAQKQYLIYEGVPQNALLWLRNRSKGIEERPFTYENGKQIWW